MPRIKVLQVITGLGPGGAERLVLDMMGTFDHARYDVRLATIVPDLRALEIYGQQDLHVDVFDLGKNSRFSGFCGIRNYIKSFSPDVIHAHMFHSLIVTMGVCSFLKKKPAICFTSHTSKHPLPRYFITRALKCLRDADIIFSSGQHPELNSKRTEVIPNGVPVQTDCPMRSRWNQMGKVRLIAVGSLTEQKDPLGLLRSIAKANHPGLMLEFVGAGPLECEARCLAHDLGIEKHVIFSGLRSDVRACMRSADLFVMHSKREGMPMALLEAGAEAMPVVATPVGSIPEILSEGRGWVTRPEQFADTLRAIIDDPSSALSAGKRLHSHVLSKHSLDATVRNHEQLYLKLNGARISGDSAV